MDLYNLALFLHITFAILLVGGSTWAHVAATQARRARTVDQVRAHVEFLHTLTKAAMPLAVLTLLAGAYLATDAGLWGEAWLLTSLGVFMALGAAAGVFIDPAVAALRAAVEVAPEGPVGDDVTRALHEPRLVAATTLMTGGDAALVFLMTNKPGLTGSMVVVAVAVGVAGLVAVRELRSQRAPATGAAPA